MDGSAVSDAPQARDESHIGACSHDHRRGTRFAASDSILLHAPLFKRLGRNTHACTGQASTAKPHDPKQQPNHPAVLTCILQVCDAPVALVRVQSTSRFHHGRLCSFCLGRLIPFQGLPFGSRSVMMLVAVLRRWY